MRLTRLLPALLLTFACCAHAQSAPDIAKLPRPTGYLSDIAGVVDPASQQEIEALCTQLDRKTASQIAIVTLQTIGDEPIDDYANKLYRTWGIGRKDSKGALLLLVIQQHKSRLEVGYGLEPLLPDGFDGSVLREMRPFLTQSQYGPGIYQGVQLLAKRVAEKSNVTLDLTAKPHYARPSRGNGGGGSGGYGSLIFILIVVAFMIFRGGGPFIGGMMGGLLGGTLGRGLGGGGGWSGGGDSGGGDSGGGFGGFGGGDSGGGGASSDW